jgi:hypothetical protein
LAADELSLATTMSVHDVQCLVAMTRRVQTRIPSVWDAWSAGDVDRDKVRQIDKCLRRLRTDEAVSVLEFEVLDEAIAKTTEQSGGRLLDVTELGRLPSHRLSWYDHLEQLESTIV